MSELRTRNADEGMTMSGPEEDDEPGGDIDWGDGNPLDQ